MKVYDYKGMKIFYVNELNGGGTRFGFDYVWMLKKKFPGRVFKRVYDFCAGCGFIGFALLREGITDSLCLSDINPKAVSCIKRTIKENNLEDVVKVYESDGLKNIPTTEKWDLVVGNPPHFSKKKLYTYAVKFLRKQKDIIFLDEKWKLHHSFYKRVSKFLSDGSYIVLQENLMGSNPLIFNDMLGKDLFFEKDTICTMNPRIYYYWVKYKCSNSKGRF